MPSVVKYPLDITGVATTHRIVNETHTLTKDKQVIVPHEAAFYTNLMTIRKGNKTLTHGIDYEFGNFYEEATRITGKEVMVTIRFLSKITGTVSLTYQTVGGEFTDLNDNVIELLESLIHDTRKVRFDDIINLPKAFPPQRHLHDISDISGWIALVTNMIEVRDAILNLRVYRNTEIYRQLEDMYVRIGEVDDVRTGLIPEMRRKLEQFESIVGTEPLVKLADYNAFKRTMESVDNTIRSQIANLTTTITNVKNSGDTSLTNLQQSLTNLLTRVNTVEQRTTDNALIPTTSYTGTQQDDTDWILIQPKGFRAGYEIQFREPAILQATKDQADRAIDLNTRLNDFVQGLEGRLLTLQTSLTELVGRLNQNDTTLETLTQQTAQINTLQEFINTSIREVRTLVSNTQTQLTNLLNNTKTELTKKVNDAQAKFTRDINAQVATINQKFTAMEGTITRLRTELNAEIERQMAQALFNLELYVRSRQSDLVTNGAGLYKNIRNFTRHDNLTFSQDTRNEISAYGWFKHAYTTSRNNPIIRPDELISIQKSFSYRITVDYQLVSPKSSFRLGFECYDLEDAKIIPDAASDGIIWLTEKVSGPQVWDTTEGIIQGGWIDKTTNPLPAVNESTFLKGTVSIKPIIEFGLKEGQTLNQNESLVSGFINLKVTPVTQLVEAKRMPGIEEAVRTIVAKMVDESRGDLEAASRWDLSTLRVQPGAESFSGWEVDGNDNLIIRGIVYMDSVNEGERGVFAPTETMTINANQTWRIPAAYDRRIAKVTIRSRSKTNADRTITHSAVREMFIQVKGNKTVVITAGDVSSFGTYLSVANGMDYDDAVTPRTNSAAGSKVYPPLITIQV